MRAHPSHEQPDTGGSHAEVQPGLQRAVRSLDRGGTALVELARYIHHVHQRPAEAERLLEEGAAKALSTLEEAWVGLIHVLAEQRKHSEALALGELARRTFPSSPRLAEAVASVQGAPAQGASGGWG